MNEDEMQDAIEPGDPLQRQLARYARVRLEPDHVAMRRVRSAVMSEAWRRHLATSEPPTTAAGPGARRVPFAGWSARRLASTMVAASLAGLLVGGTVFAGTRAGGPLYGARLAFEAVLLPADPDARVQAELALAQTRLAEAAQAAAAGDTAAFDAALVAYVAVIDELAEATGGPADQALAAVEVHLAVLRDLRVRVPAAAGAGIDRALERGGTALERLERAGARDPSGGKTPNAEATPKPGSTPKPGKTSDPTEKPASTPKPGNTPKPGKTASPEPALDPTPDGTTGSR